jgi:hypothetical protein
MEGSMNVKARKNGTLVSIILVGIIVLCTYSLPAINNLVKKQSVITVISNEYINSILIYQVVTLALAALLIFLLFLSRRTSFRKYFSLGKINARAETEKIIGLYPKEHENWIHIGLNFTVLISLVSGIVIFFQVIRNNSVNHDNLAYIPFIFLFALMNSFTEEMITRFGVVVALDEILPKKGICAISAFIFGSVHYFSTPGGILGVLLAGFLGWLLSKSIIETKGIFWSWVIHCVQDIIIYTGLFFVML